MFIHKSLFPYPSSFWFFWSIRRYGGWTVNACLRGKRIAFLHVYLSGRFTRLFEDSFCVSSSKILWFCGYWLTLRLVFVRKECPSVTFLKKIAFMTIFLFILYRYGFCFGIVIFQIFFLPSFHVCFVPVINFFQNVVLL